MEDRHVTLSEIAPGVFYSAVFDGHGGPKTAEFAQQHLQTMIRNRDSLTASLYKSENSGPIRDQSESTPRSVRDQFETGSRPVRDQKVNPNKEIRIFSKNAISLEPVSRALF